ncbi:MAG: ribosome silencing factor [Epulopiscium sp.]|nr:ribosome silencing factor [Candidatus Epulonipiscium sp.]
MIISEQGKEMLRVVYHALDEKQGEDIRILDIHGISILADYFVITHGNNQNHVQALAEHVIESLAEAGYRLLRREGEATSSWILLDYGHIMIHVFGKEERNFYDLERIWSDGKEITASHF